EHGVRARRAGRQLARAREEIRRPVLHRAEQAAGLVVVDRPPRSPVVLRLTDPLALVGASPAPRLPPDALVAHRRSGVERRAREAGDPRGHSILSTTTTSTEVGSTSAMLMGYPRTRACTARPSAGIER